MSIIINEDRLLLVEGVDDDRFFSKLLDHIFPNARLLQILKYNGNRKLSAYLDGLVKTATFARVTKLGIVTDADNSASGALSSVQNALRQTGKLVAPSAASLSIILCQLLGKRNSSLEFDGKPI